MREVDAADDGWGRHSAFQARDSTPRGPGVDRRFQEISQRTHFSCQETAQDGDP